MTCRCTHLFFFAWPKGKRRSHGHRASGIGHSPVPYPYYPYYPYYPLPQFFFHSKSLFSKATPFFFSKKLQLPFYICIWVRPWLFLTVSVFLFVSAGVELNVFLLNQGAFLLFFLHLHLKKKQGYGFGVPEETTQAPFTFAALRSLGSHNFNFPQHSRFLSPHSHSFLFSFTMLILHTCHNMG